MRDNDCVEPAVAQRFPVRKRFFAFKLRVHSRVEDQATPGSF